MRQLTLKYQNGIYRWLRNFFEGGGGGGKEWGEANGEV